MKAALALALVCTGFPVCAQPASPAVLHQFTGTPDGANPYGGVVFDANGTIYGTTNGGGGPQNNGVVFSLAPPSSPGAAWTETILWAPPEHDGINPYGTPAIGPDGTLYGTLFGGNGGGNGAAFALHPPTAPGAAWTPQILHEFRGSPDAASPTSGPLLIGSTLYGTTSEGGKSNAGAVYAIQLPSAPGRKAAESVLYSFAGDADCGNPFGPVVAGPSGTLYGTTRFGGANGYGCVFQLAPPAASGSPWTKQILYSFSGSPDAYPIAGVVVAPNGSLYGATFGIPASAHDFGNVYQLTLPTTGSAWTYTNLHAFAGGKTDAADPTGITIGPNGTLYVTAFAGAASVVAITPAGESLLGDAGPVYSPVAIGSDGALYGAGFGKYASAKDHGAVFRIPLK